MKSHQAQPAPAAVYDLRGLRCPLPVLKTRRKLQGMQAGETLAVLSDDPLAPLDLALFCQKAGYGIARQAEQGFVRFLITRT